jgi:hypothetical protein
LKAASKIACHSAILVEFCRLLLMRRSWTLPLKQKPRLQAYSESPIELIPFSTTDCLTSCAKMTNQSSKDTAQLSEAVIKLSAYRLLASDLFAPPFVRYFYCFPYVE